MQIDDEAELLKLSMKSLKEHYGFNPGKERKAARDLGHQLGIELSNRITGKTIDPIVDQLAGYWIRNGIGEMSWQDRTNMLLKIESCSDCLGQGRGAGYTLCPFKEGLLEAVLTTKTGSNYKVQEVECCGTLAPSCVFEISQT